MTATQTQMMLPSTTARVEAWKGNGYAYEQQRRNTVGDDYANQAPRSYGPLTTTTKQHMDPPRPLEPHPTHNHASSLHDSSTSQRRSDSLNGHNDGYRSNGHQSLPGLRDILSPTTSQVTSQYYPGSWASNPSAPPPEHRHSGGQYASQGQHPSLPIHPPTDVHLSHHIERRLELPILETQPRPRHPPSHNASPYTPYPDPGRDYIEARHERPRQHSTNSYIANGVRSPYTPASMDDSVYRNSGMSQPPPYPPSGPEASQKKYLGVRDCPGEGQFHVYEGGLRIPTHVDGETVNPQWGLTKANKPRKRLALACLDCREKKIKCEPSATSCLQCDKAKRLCRRAPNANSPPNEGTSSTGWSPTAHADSPAAGRAMERASDLALRQDSGAESDSVVKRRALADPAAVAASGTNGMLLLGSPAKRHRASSSPSTIHAELPPPAMSMAMGPAAGPHALAQRPFSSASGPRVFAWEEDPYLVDPAMTMHLMDIYFAHVNNATYCMFPRNVFLRWVERARDKCYNERMTLYAMMAMASVFAGESCSGVGKHCAQIAQEAVMARFGRFGVSIVQTRLLLALYNFSKGAEGPAWDYCGMAIRAISAMRYNNEEGCVQGDDDANPDKTEYGFTKEQVAECKRRTFWAGFLMDRYNGFCGGMLCIVDTADIYLRLPCSEGMYERGEPSDAPFFNNKLIDPARCVVTPTSRVSPMAYLAMISAIWGDVMNFVYRAVHRDNDGYGAAYEAFYAQTHAAMADWHARLPDHLQFHNANLDRSIREGHAGTFVSMHVLPHFTLLVLNRYVRHAQLRTTVPRNIKAAHQHASQLLRIMRDVQSARRELATAAPDRHLQTLVSTPFLGYATLSAIDIVSAGGPDSKLRPILDGMADGLDYLKDLAQYWNSAKGQLKTADWRSLQIRNVLTRPYKSPSGAWLGRNWGIETPLEKEFELENDCIYGVGTALYFHTMGEEEGMGKVVSNGAHSG